MKQKILTITGAIILLIGIVAAAGTITNLSPSLDIPNFIAGDTTETTFSFDYEDDGFNNPDASLVLRVNISSLDLVYPLGEGEIINGYWDETTQECRSAPDRPTGVPYYPDEDEPTFRQCCFNQAHQQVDCNNPDILWEGVNKYPVWKKDFQLSGFIEQYSLFDLFLKKIFPLKCVEDSAEFRVQQGLLYTETNVPAGTFYCYDPDNYLDMLELGRRDKTTLFISSDPALYPGEYGVSVELMEIELDNQGPEIELIKPSGGQIFSELNEVIPIKLNITDMYNIDNSSVKYKIVSLGIPSEGEGLNVDYYDSGWIYDINYNEATGLYEAEFNIQEHGLTESGSYWLYAEAKDMLGNEGKL